jgi:exopolysaccharide production protein ExoZ
MIIGVQALRGIAALAVVLMHALGEAGAMAGTPGVSPWPALRDLPFYGGVDLFFVISGFVMVHASRTLFGRRDAVGTFLARRVARVVPLYWMVTFAFAGAALTLPVRLDDPFGGPGTLLASLLFVPWQRPDGSMLPVFRLGWTLNYEMFFYVLFACWLSLPRRRAVAGVVGTLAALTAAGAVLQPVQPQLAFWTDPLLLEFGAGVLVGLARTEGVRLDHATRLLLAVVGIALLPLLAQVPGLHRAVAIGLPSACLVAAAVFARGGTEAPRGPIAAGFVVIGDASYALYLVHLFTLRALREVWQHGGVPLAWLAGYLVLGICISVLVAVLVHRFIERPVVLAVRQALERPVRSVREPTGSG